MTISNDSAAIADYTNTNESVSFRLGAALRANAVSDFIGGCYRVELAELTAKAVSNRSMVSESSARAIIHALYTRVESFDAQAARFPRFAVKFTALADAAEAAQLAWHAANSEALRAA